MSNYVEIEVDCPDCKKGKVVGYCEVDSEGNSSGHCDECDSNIGFHYVIEIDGIYSNG